ncbi:TetR/AcrR family transcriptional regulator [Glycomyces sp. NPDC046736]|uniref:TetR/AcrR family transcriptional regulator n=1 Tax=Glycomyces sp. NPDC046736 TaxID=3155615 RepID=UPI0033D0361D
MKSNVADDVLRCALDLFAEQGYANTSVQQIVDAAGVTKGAMYHYFTSKDDLLFAIHERMLSHQERRLDEITAAGGPTEDVLRAVCEDVILSSIAHLAEGTVFFRSRHMLTPERRAEVKRRTREYHEKFAAIVDRGKTEDLFRVDISTSVLIAHFFSDVHYLPQWLDTEGPENRSEVAAELTELFLRSIRRIDA